jgi:hypothetical protein
VLALYEPDLLRRGVNPQSYCAWGVCGADDRATRTWCMMCNRGASAPRRIHALSYFLPKAPARDQNTSWDRGTCHSQAVVCH